MRLSDCISIVRDTLGGQPAVQTATLIANHAGSLVYNMHPWRFARRGPVWLATLAGNDTVSLPADYGGYISITGTREGPLTILDAEAFALHRSGQLTRAFGTVGLVVGTDSGLVPTPAALRVYPTPTVSDSQAYQLVYYRTWQSLVDQNSYVPLPRFIHPLFVEVLIESAKGYDESEHGTLSDRIGRISSGAVFMAAVRADGIRHAIPTQLRNGIGQFGGRGIFSRDQVEWPGG